MGRVDVSVVVGWYRRAKRGLAALLFTIPSSCDRSSGWLAEKPEKGTKRRPDGRTATTAENAAARPSGHP